MTSHGRQSAGAAFFFVLVLLGVGATMTARSQGSAVVFTGVFPTPLVAGGVLETGASAAIHVGLTISNNSGGALRFSAYRSVLPELLNASGAVVPFDYGANRSRGPLVSDYPLVPAGESLVIPLDASLMLQGGELDWKGSDGVLGFWKIARAGAPYRIRLRYRQMQTAAGPFEGSSETLNGLWNGESATAAVELPLKFVD